MGIEVLDGEEGQMGRKQDEDDSGREMQTDGDK